MVSSVQVREPLAQRGTIRGRTFFHRDLGFQFVFPAEWRICRAGQTVVGLSGEQDAVIRLRVLPGMPDEVAHAFFRQPEMQSGPLATHLINGLDAVTGGFLIDTGNWLVRGLATFLAYDRRTYEVTGSTTNDVFDQYRVVLRESLESFDRLLVA